MRKLIRIGATAIVILTTAGASLATAGAAAAEESRPSAPAACKQLRGLLTADEWLAVGEATRTAHEAAHDELREAVLTPLVSDGTLTQAQLDTILAEPRRRGLHALVLSGDLTREQARAVRAALRTQGQDDHAAVLASALSGLVQGGTITQQQADSLAAAAAEGCRPSSRPGARA